MPQTNDADAIQTDVSGDEQTLPLQPTARELMMEGIASRHLTNVKGDFEGDFDPDVDPDNPDADQLALQTQERPVAAPASESQPAVHRVKVDGEERVVTDDELIRSYQKNAAADRRLEEASALLREANERAAQAAAQMAAPRSPEPVAPPAELQAQVDTVLSKLYEGDQAEASAALAGLLMSTRGGDQPTTSPPIDIEQLTMQIKQSMEVDKAFETIQSDYPDLINDSNLEMLTAMKIDKAIASGTPRAQAMLDAAEDVYKSLGKVPTGRQADLTKPKTNARLENKQRLDIVNPASAAAGRISTPIEENVSSVIAEMASRRVGQSIPRRA